MTPSTTPELADSPPSAAAFTGRLQARPWPPTLAGPTPKAGPSSQTGAGPRHGPLAATPGHLVDFFVATASRRRAGTDTLLAFGTLVLIRCAIRRRYADANLTSPTHHPDVTAIFKGLARLRGAASRRFARTSWLRCWRSARPRPSAHGTRPCWRSALPPPCAARNYAGYR